MRILTVVLGKAPRSPLGFSIFTIFTFSERAAEENSGRQFIASSKSNRQNRAGTIFGISLMCETHF